MPSSRSRKAELERLGAVPFAHRGLHGAGLVENSGGAIAAAVARGFGIELDVQLSRDGAAMVFHDYELDRLTSERGPVAERSATELQAIRLNVCGEKIPSLSEALGLIGGRAPLLVEVKSRDRGVSRLCSAVAAALKDYEGPAGVMSFNPEVGRWFARRAPRVLRGLVVTENGSAQADGEPPAEGPVASLVALMSWGPNVDAATWFTRSRVSSGGKKRKIAPKRRCLSSRRCARYIVPAAAEVPNAAMPRKLRAT